ncbi:STE3-domain-containing protein [Lactarius deliciosus]|nr:STE3-domain-containing protein [Lactarius deliciosus]
MAWVGLGCLIQCINSIVWNGNMIIRIRVYCDIVTRFQIGLNVAISACSLCINRRLYKIATTKAVMVTRSEKRRAVITDLLIGLGIPILQILARTYTFLSSSASWLNGYFVDIVVSGHRFNIIEDFGPYPSIVLMTPSIPLFLVWPIVVGTVSLFYCFMTIYHFHKRGRQFSQIMSSNRGLNQSRYFRLMCLALIEVLGTIPLASFVLSYNIRLGFHKWVSWADTHSNYQRIIQISSIVWKSDNVARILYEFNRWSLVMCAFIFFAFFGFADEARKHYRLVYTSIASRVGLSTSNGKLSGSSHATSSFPHMSSKGGVTISVTQTSGDFKRDSMFSVSDRLSIPSISIASDLKPDFKTDPYSPSESTASSSVSSFQAEIYDPSSESTTTSLTPPPASVSPLFPETPRSTIRPTSTYSIDAAHAV